MDFQLAKIKEKIIGLRQTVATRIFFLSVSLTNRFPFIKKLPWKIILLVSAIVFLAIISSIFFRIRQSSSPKNQAPSLTKTPTSSTTSGIILQSSPTPEAANKYVNWTTYTNKSIGFETKCPPDWFCEAINDSSIISPQEPKDSLAQWLTISFSTQDGEGKTWVGKQKIGDYFADFAEDSTLDSSHKYYFLKEADQSFLITVFSPASQNQAVYEKFVSDILASFKLTNLPSAKEIFLPKTHAQWIEVIDSKSPGLCEQSSSSSMSQVNEYRTEKGRLAIIACRSYAYQTSQVAVYTTASGDNLLLTFKEYISSFETINSQVVSELRFDKKTQELSTFYKGRGAGDCGSQGTYKLNETAAAPELKEFLFQDCETAVGADSSSWPQVFP